VVALEKDAMFVAWKELGETPRVRTTALRCLD